MKHHRLEAWQNARAVSKDRHEMAALLNVSPFSVSKLLSYYGLPRFGSVVHSDETRKRTIDLYRSGLTLREVSGELKLSPGAVAGILSRAGVLGERIARIKVNAAVKRAAEMRNRLVIPPKFKRNRFKAKPDPVTPLCVSLDDRQADQCCYPYGDGPFSYCGHPKQPGFSYCPDHCAIVYRAPETRQRAPRPR